MTPDIEMMSSRSVSVFAVTIAIFACATLFVFLRMASRTFIVKRVSLDDYFILVAWVITFGLTFSICYGATVGLGRHESNVLTRWQVPLDKSQYAFSVLYNPALMAEKTSILVFYLSLSQTNKVFRWATIGVLFVVNAAGLALTIVTILQCRPVSASFITPTPASASCTDIVTIYLSSAPVNILTDLAILFLPMPILTGMRLPRKQKAIVIITFGFGIFVAAVDVVRIAYLQSASTYRLHELEVDSSSSGRDTDATDFSWYASFSFMWSAIEVSVGIMCACVPALKPLVSRFMPHLLRDSDDPVTEKSASLTSDETVRMAVAHRVPSMPDAAFVRDFAHSDPSPEPVGMMDFLTIPADMPASEPAEEPGMANMDFITRPSMAKPAERTEMGLMDFLNSPESQKPAARPEMGLMDFLSTPDMNELPAHLQRTQTALTNTSRDTRAATPTFFDFIDMKGRKSLVRLTNRESIYPITMVTILFFIWGFEYGLLNVLNQQFQAVAGISSGQSVGLHSAYFAGYLVGPLTIGRLVFKYWGFRACFTIGLAIYACGTLIFWPAAVLTSFPAFVVVNFIVGFGLSILELAADPFIILCGPMEYAEIRFGFSQGFQAIGTVVAPLIAAKAFTKDTSNTPSLINTQWAYLGISLFTVLLAIAYYYIPLPEATDQELEEVSERVDGANNSKIGTIPIIWILLGLGVLSQFCYVGGQEAVGTTFDSYLRVVEPTFNATNFTAIGHALFALSRFLAALAGFFVSPRILLLICYTGAILFSALAMNFSGATATTLTLLVFFFEGPIFNLVFAQALRGMGKHTKPAAVLLTAAISGGAVFPAISHAVAGSRGVQYALCVAVAAFAGGALMPLALNLHPLARRLVDPMGDRRVSSPGPSADHRPPSWASGRATQRALSFFSLRKKGGKEDVSAEWRERRASGEASAASSP